MIPERSSVLLLCDMPPPVHGMSTINNAFVDLIRSEDATCHLIDTSPTIDASRISKRSSAVKKLIRTLTCFISLIGCLMKNKYRIVYRPINAGYGLLYDILYLSVCKFSAANIIIHHHSFNYLNSNSKLFAFMNRFVCPDARHVVLGSAMAERLRDLYRVSDSKFVHLSNIAFFETSESSPIEMEGAIRIGYLSNLCREKGLFEFSSVCRELRKRGVKFTASIAGPFIDQEASSEVERLCRDLSCVNYCGPLYGEEKNRFFRNQDIFIFPTKYRHEAEPLVLYEAAQHGVFNIASKRGCIEEVIRNLNGKVILESECMYMDIADEVQRAQNDGVLDKDKRAERLELFCRCKQIADKNLQRLLAEVANGDESLELN